MKRVRPVCHQGKDGDVDQGEERKERRREEKPSPDAERGGGGSMQGFLPWSGQGAGVATSLLSRYWRAGFSLK